MTATAIPSALVRSGEERLDVGARENTDEGTMVALAGRRQYPLDLRGTCGRLEGRIAEERADGGQTQIACAGFNVAGLLQVIQKCCHERCVDILECQLIRRFVQTLMSKPKQQPKGIPIRTDGMRTGLFLLHEPLGKESLQ